MPSVRHNRFEARIHRRQTEVASLGARPASHMHCLRRIKVVLPLGGGFNKSFYDRWVPLRVHAGPAEDSPPDVPFNPAETLDLDDTGDDQATYERIRDSQSAETGPPSKVSLSEEDLHRSGDTINPEPSTSAPAPPHIASGSPLSAASAETLRLSQQLAANPTMDGVSPETVQKLLATVEKQAKLMGNYQKEVDQLKARLLQSHKVLSQLVGDDGQLDTGARRAERPPADEPVPSGTAPPAPVTLSSGSGNGAGRTSRPLGVAPPLPPSWQSADRRLLGSYDARYHSASSGATPSDFRVLPERIILVRHAQSEGNIDNVAYTYIPDPQIPLTALGWQQAADAGRRILDICGTENRNHKFFFYTSPYRRSVETYSGMTSVLQPEQVMGVQEEVQLREQDFGNFQNAEGKRREKSERLRFGRFFYRFPNGESGADVYDRITIFEDHMVRDINAGRFSSNSSLVLLTHGLSLRIFLMRWFHWTVDEFLNVFNPPNAAPLVLERVCSKDQAAGSLSWIHTKSLYRLSDESRKLLKGVTEEMCRTSDKPNGISMLQSIRTDGNKTSV